ncbi:MAG: hypothetical protein WD342_16640 [Verrucomicrobiales bacterium]
MNRSLHLFLAGLLLALPAIPERLAAQGDGPGDAEEGDWLENYYRDPDPDQFVPRMKDWSEDGTLDNENARPALIAFISRLVRQNRDRLDEWYRDLSGLSPEHKQVLHTGMLFSRTTEADRIMSELFGERYEGQKRDTEKILEMPLDKQPTVDMLWGFFYATGSESAIRRIVLCFRFEDAPERPEGVNVPDGYVPHYKQLPTFAFNSLVANAERHPRVLEILEDLHRNDESLVKPEKEGVYDVLSEVDPEEYPPVDREGKSV